MEIMNITTHRPWPILDSRWRVRMRWHDLLFAHWPVPVERLRAMVPRSLEVDTFKGEAWLGVVPFWMSGIRLRGWPRVPTAHRFAELNVRTYVTDGHKPGVWFFSLDAASRLAVEVARRWYGLNYRKARIVCENGGGRVRYDSRCEAEGAFFRAEYRATSEPFVAIGGSLEHWLCERYCMYMGGGGRAVRRGEIHHPAWSLQRAEANITHNSMAEAMGLVLSPSPAHLLYVKRMDAVAWGPRKASDNL